MNLKFWKRPKPEAAPVVTGPKPHIKTWEVRVPAGHVMPLGEVIGEGFKVIVEAGVRWHPEWAEPRITVNVWRFFSHGDCVGWSGKEALSFKSLLPAEVAALVPFHGQCQSVENIPALNSLGVEAPPKPQTYAEFIAAGGR
jgi:hypothetical protein